eukprot:jgi/Bigna1/126757/aug1.3_g1465
MNTVWFLLILYGGENCNAATIVVTGPLSKIGCLKESPQISYRQHVRSPHLQRMVRLKCNEKKEMETLRCFTMSQPFAALLMNGYKTIESRNHPMFEGITGSVALHVGRKDWPDDTCREILSDWGMDDSQIKKCMELPNGFKRGDVVGIVELGDTFLRSQGHINDRGMQRRVCAGPSGMGRYLTPITSASYLNRPFKAKGQPGVWKVELPRDIFPE